MPDSFGPQKDGPDVDQPEIRPLSRSASRILILMAALLAVAVSTFAAYMLIDAAREAREPDQEVMDVPPPDTTAAPFIYDGS